MEIDLTVVSDCDRVKASEVSLMRLAITKSAELETFQAIEGDELLLVNSAYGGEVLRFSAWRDSKTSTTMANLCEARTRQQICVDLRRLA